MSSESETFPLVIENDHLLISLKGRLAILDTGSPFSLHRSDPLVLSGRPCETRPDIDGILDMAHERMGERIEWLIGANLLAASQILIDWPSGTVALTSDALRESCRWNTGIRMNRTVPMTTIEVGGGSCTAVIDSGAPISYGPVDLVREGPVRGEREDFYPGYGEFTVTIHEILASIAGERLSLLAATLPPKLARQLAGVVGQDGWIVGADLFRERRIVLDFPKLWMGELGRQASAGSRA